MFDQRFFKITVAVLLFHAGLLYLIQSGLARKMTEAVIAPEIIARIIPMEPPQQQKAPEPPKPQKTPEPPKQRCGPAALKLKKTSLVDSLLYI